MAQNQISISFQECEPTPALGYQIKYRPLGSGGPFRTWPVLFTESPAVFVDNLDPELTDYEGTIQAICSETERSIPIPWVSYNNESPSQVESESESASESESEPCAASINWDFTEDFANGSMQIRVNGVIMVNTSVTNNGILPIQAGDVINVRVNGSTGTLRMLVITGCINEDETSTTASVIIEFTAECDCVYEVTGNVASL